MDVKSSNSSGDSDAGDGEAGRWLLWVDENSALSLGHLPPPALVGRIGNLPTMYTLDLLASETVSQVSTAAALLLLVFCTVSVCCFIRKHRTACTMQVAWQTLADASTPSNTKSPPLAAVGAILTSQRLLVVSPELRILVASPSGVAIISCLWVGPALLYSTSDHQVRCVKTAKVALVVMVDALSPHFTGCRVVKNLGLD